VIYGYARVSTDAQTLAEFERSLILSRTGEGRTRAMARGVKFGRKPKVTAHQIAEARARKEAGEALSDIGSSFNISPQHHFEAVKGWLQ
jgi:DNA invertase Pin-like site-specific DNA recombinase